LAVCTAPQGRDTRIEMLVLGIESSCDETAAAVLADGRRVLSSVVASQDALHAPYGGVVPELASRRHLEMIVPVVEKALSDAGARLPDLDGIAVTQGPGLVGGPIIETTATTGDPKAITFPLAHMSDRAPDFSFSGVKTSVSLYVKRHGHLSGQQVADVAASFQAAVVKMLVRKSVKAA